MKRMKKYLSLLPIISVILCGCSANGSSPFSSSEESLIASSEESISSSNAESPVSSISEIHVHDYRYHYDELGHQKYCNGCSYVEEKEEHNFVEEIIYPTEESHGYTKHICTVCGYTYQDKETQFVTYTVIWKNEDDTILEVDIDVRPGTTPTYDGETPSKESDEQYDYVFSLWSPEVDVATSNITYTAQYESEIRCYTVIWMNSDYTLLEIDKEVPYGTIPTYDGEKPTRSGTIIYDYIFSGWSPLVTAVKSDIVYVAQYYSRNINPIICED